MTDVISIMEQIAIRPDFKFCDDPNERSGLEPKLCVYQDIGHYEFVGCIRFADEQGKYCLSADESIMIALNGEDDE